MPIIDLRSDTVTQPAPGMREAMAQAAVGDDVYGEDPSINTLQAMSAAMLGKEAGLFVPSGTMGNLASLLAHCNRGDEIIMGDVAHTFLYEAGGVAALGGIQPHIIPNQPDGTLALEDILAAIRGNDAHLPPTRLIALENTHNRCGGAALSVEYTQSIGELAKENDGAYVIASTGKEDIEQLVSVIRSKYKNQQQGEVTVKERVEFFYYPLGLGLLFLLIAFSSAPRPRREV